MIRRSILAAVCALGLTRGASAQTQGQLVAARFEVDDVQVAPDLKVGPEGLGPIHAGMSVAEASRALDRPLRAPGGGPRPGDPEAAEEWRTCHYEFTPELPGVAFQVASGRIARVEVLSGAYGTTRGVRIGTPEAEVLRRYPGVSVRPHPQASFGHYLVLTTVSPGGARSAIVFETDGKAVTAFRSGAQDAVDDDGDGCP